MALTALVLALLALAVGCRGTAPEPEIRLVPPDPSGVFEVTGLDSRTLDAVAAGTGSVTLSVTVAGGTGDLPGMAGRVRVAAGALQFQPRFLLRPGSSYRAVYEGPVPGGQSARISRTFELPALDMVPRAEIVAVFPSADTLPENLLRFYLHFSAPMQQGRSYQRVRLLGPDGAVELAFLEIGEELWDRSGTRLTLLIDPGRIKRGLRPRDEEGPVLVEGNTYSLVVDAAWPDAEGRPLRSGHRRDFRVVSPDLAQPDPETWEILAPPVASRAPLVVRFPEPLDHALLHRMLRVRRADRTWVDGAVAIADGETRWEFEPSRPWVAGEHELVVDAALEDRSGNSIAAPFEVDVARPPTPGAQARTRAFTVLARTGRPSRR